MCVHFPFNINFIMEEVDIKKRSLLILSKTFLKRPVKMNTIISANLFFIASLHLWL
eukprot:UN02643